MTGAAPDLDVVGLFLENPVLFFVPLSRRISVRVW